jgi:uncharacterized protein YwgA
VGGAVMERDRKRKLIILELVRRCNRRWGNTGKLQIQKFIYFLQEVIGVELGYRYVMYHYGPFCFELNDNLETLGIMGVLNIEQDPSGYGYSISTGAYAQEPDTEEMDFLRQHEEEIDLIIETFGEMKAEDLEIISTIHFVASILKKKSEQYDKQNVVEQVRRLKPKFDLNYIGKVYDTLDEVGWL